MVALNQTVDTSTPASGGLPTGEYTGVVISEEVKTSQKGAQYLRYTLQVTEGAQQGKQISICLLYTSPSPRDGLLSRMPSSA